ncbi:D-cysteine desulfhydrase family protein [Fusobacterium varium]|uniref:D-cysteine desulfhydrase family protein n=1 Tax=Fusobacterium varium TaxID=856 RepID=UPI000E402C83|nr:D-cysteine desulfhydrase family protein [Fusobacterium varium]MCF0170315.1 D-cysteine desulfhydrase family protein [Fusobacterium varium]MDY4005463.1 D-cysteine desulfhydrase family protein [Fusobacterium varium]RGJ31293.1 D-cysteine desulfhydrase family protein [Fusobacterium varium]
MQKKLSLANFPTKIEKLEKISNESGVNIYIKRDDQTGSEISGNKIRKLEYSIYEALENGCDTLITCGGIQSNHARATAAAGIKLGMRAILVLRSDETPEMEGNYFLDKVIGADVRIISSDDYRERRMEIMEKIKAESDAEGHKAYIIPEGASNGIGSLGYYSAMKEIKEQEKELGIKFDRIVAAVGSGGTYAGLCMGNAEFFNGEKKITGFNVCDDAEFFKKRSEEIIEEAQKYLDKSIIIKAEEMDIIDGYVGIGYAQSRDEELEFIQKTAKKEGVIFDPVYTGKAMYGMMNEIEKGTFKKGENVLFIHTGGLFGIFSKRNQFKF